MGLIFLSAMTTAIAHTCREQGLDALEALGSSLLTIALSTFVVGLLVVLTGAFPNPEALWGFMAEAV